MELQIKMRLKNKFAKSRIQLEESIFEEVDKFKYLVLMIVNVGGRNEKIRKNNKNNKQGIMQTKCH